MQDRLASFLLAFFATSCTLFVAGCSVLLSESGDQKSDGGFDSGFDARSGQLYEPFGSIAPFLAESLPQVDISIDVSCTFDTTDLVADCPTEGAAVVIEQAAGQEVAILRARSVTITRALVIVGTRPMVVITERLELINGGAIDAGSRVASARGGPGGRACGSMEPLTASGRAGAAGGGFEDAGGNGGNATSGTPGVGEPDPTLKTELRGGCQGGASSSTVGGLGGGALQLVATERLMIAGSINVGGAGGAGGPNGSNGGGSGGGSGGMLVLDSPTIVELGPIGTFGGGGGAGGGSDDGEPGTDGLADRAGSGGDGLLSGAGSGGVGGSSGGGGMGGSVADGSGAGGGGGDRNSDPQRSNHHSQSQATLMTASRPRLRWRLWGGAL